eukprot:scaffold28_cov180-Chaetoceros_neogracile.AAC.4
MAGKGPNFFMKRKYLGDYANLREVIDADISDVKELRIDVQLQILEVAVDARAGIVVDINFEDFEITWWVVLKVWLPERWKAFKNVFTNAVIKSSVFTNTVTKSSAISSP